MLLDVFNDAFFTLQEKCSEITSVQVFTVPKIGIRTVKRKYNKH